MSLTKALMKKIDNEIEMNKQIGRKFNSILIIDQLVAQGFIDAEDSDALEAAEFYINESM